MFLRSKCFVAGVALSLWSVVGSAYEYCDAHVQEISVNVHDGTTWIELADNTKLKGTAEDIGLDENISIALAAQMADKKVKAVLNDGESCGTNALENWTYLIPYRQ